MVSAVSGPHSGSSTAGAEARPAASATSTGLEAGAAKGAVELSPGGETLRIALGALASPIRVLGGKL